MTGTELTTALELLPCPFCGWEAEVVSGGPGNHFIQCKGCRATSDDRHLDRAIAAWNRREAATALSEAKAENERLREVLKPFANMLPDSYSTKDALQARLQEWCRAARAALNPKGGDNA